MALTTAEKVGIWVGVYGAVLSTVNSVVQYIAGRKDRTDIRLRIQRNMARTDRMQEKYTIVSAVNRGKRPAQIEGFAARLLDRNTNLLFPDVRPQVPHMLNESQTIAAWIRVEADPGLMADIETFFAYDSVGREFVHHIVPVWRRLLSRHRRKSAKDQPTKVS